MIHDLTATRLAKLIAAGELTALEVTEGFLQQIEATESEYQSFLSLTAEGARERAKRLDAQRAVDPTGLGSLAGVPMALKDNISTQGVATTCASKILAGYVPPFDATIAARLQGAGSLLMGKTNLDEFAMGSSTENSAYQLTRNPWDLGRVPGGSSGGSAAAVAGGQVAFALGTDTGGSIRQPAAYCGIVGLKPTYGLVSRYGVVAFASSLDQAGPMTKDVTDSALVLNALVGRDPKDAMTVDPAVADFTVGLEAGVKGLRIGVPKEYFTDGIDTGVKAQVEEALKQFEGLGAQLVPVSLPHTEYAVSAYYLIAPAEACSNLARFDGVRYGQRASGQTTLTEMYEQTRGEGFGPEVKRRIMLGTYALASGSYDHYFKKAQQVRTLVIEDFKQAFAQVDLLVSPTTPHVAPKIGEQHDPLTTYLADAFTIPVNLAGLPAISVPCGLADGLPVGLQLIGPAFAEQRLLQAAYAFEQSTEHHLAKPGR